MASAVRQTVVAPLGLMTTPNPVGQYPAGALSIADGVSMRAPGELRALPDYQSETFTGLSVTDKIWKTMCLDSGHVYSFTTDSTGTTWTVTEGPIGGTQTVATYPLGLGGHGNLFTTGRICPVRSRERMLVNSTVGEMVGDSMAPSSTATRALRFAGMPQLNCSFGANDFTAGPIPPLVMVAYTAILVRQFADGYSIKSVPCPAASFYNDDGSGLHQNNTVIGFFAWDTSSVIAGDIIEWYRTDGLSTNSPDADPGTTFKLIQSYTLTSTDVTGNFVQLIDTAACAAPFYTTSGRELYTNPGQEGELAANRQPDACGASAVFKGYTFYANITERPQVVLSAPAGFGSTNATSPAFDKANKIGTRAGAGTITSGSPTITAIPAGQTTGVVAGQKWTGFTSHFPFSTAVVSVTSTSITLASNALSSSTTDGWIVSDVIEINGLKYLVEDYGGFASQTVGFEFTYSATINPADDNYNAGDTLIVEPWRAAYESTLTVRATNGANYSPPLPAITATVATFAPKTTKNLMRWSKNSEPEHVPSTNEDFVGSATIIQLVSTKDALWIFCTDGIFRLSGDAGVWRVDVIDPKCVLCAPQCATSLHETVYAYTNYGFVSVTDSGVTPISLNRVTDLLPGAAFAERGDMIVDRDAQNHEILISLSAASNIIYIYNTPNDAFTRIGPTITAFNTLAAVSFMDQPASGVPCVLLSFNTAFGPLMATWNSTTAWLEALVQYREFYGDDPLSQKQWISATWLFAVSDAGKTVTTFVNTFSSGFSVIRKSFTGGYATCGILRAHAISPTIEPGIDIPFTTQSQTVIRGVSLYLCEYTQQPWRQE